MTGDRVDMQWTEAAARKALDEAFLVALVQRHNQRNAHREEAGLIAPPSMNGKPDLYVAASTELSVSIVMTRAGRKLYGPMLGIPANSTFGEK